VDKNQPKELGGNVRSHLLRRIDHEHGASALKLDSLWTHKTQRVYLPQEDAVLGTAVA
jgi:hypothetical protein